MPGNSKALTRSGAVQLRLVTFDEGEDPELSQHSTLTEFFRLWFLPEVCHRRNHDAKYIALFRDALTWWVKLTGDPPLVMIDRPMLNEFAQSLAATSLSSGTVRKHLQSLNRIFGPTAGGSFEHHAGLLKESPRAPVPAKESHEVRHSFTSEEVGRLLQAAEHMQTPNLIVPCPKPAQWWASLVIVAYLQGFRIGTVLQLEFSHVAGGWWNIPPKCVKGHKKALIRQVHPQAQRVLESIEEPSRTTIWPWYGSQSSRRFFFRQVERLVRLAGLPDSYAFRTHALRRGHATALAAVDPEIARISLGHSLFQTTANHYINANIVGRAAAGISVTHPLAKDPQ